MMTIKGFLSFNILLLLSVNTFAHKGLIATYKADELYISFYHADTKEIFKEPVLMGVDVTIKYNISFESFTISYTNVKSKKKEFFTLSFVRYDKDQKNALIMKDGHNNPVTVFNDIGTENSLNIMDHRLMDNKYLFVQSMVDIKLVN